MKPVLAHVWMVYAKCCHYKVRIRRVGASVFVPKPTAAGQGEWRLEADYFDEGGWQFRGDWCIEPWSKYAAREALGKIAGA